MRQQERGSSRGTIPSPWDWPQMPVSASGGIAWQDGRMTVRVRVDIGASLTFGDLYQFVDLARASSVSPDAKVVQVPISNQEPELGIDSFELEIAPMAQFEPPVILQAAEARSLASVLD